MSRPRKLSKWTVGNRLGKYRTVSEAALDLGIGRTQLYATLKAFGFVPKQLLQSNWTRFETPAAPKLPLFLPAAPKYATPPPEPVPSSQGDRKHKLDDCWCGKRHRATLQGTPAPRTNSLAMSYAPPKRNGE